MFSSLQSAIGDLGFINGMLYLLGRVMQALSGGRSRLIRYHIVAQPVSREFVPVCRPSATEKVIEIAAHAAIIEAFPRPPEVLKYRFARGHVCLAAVNKGVFAGFLWYARDHYEEDEVHCRFVLSEPDSTVWDYDVHVEPRFRMGRTFARLWDAANERLAALGVDWSCSRISAFNRQSLQSHRRLGISVLETLTFICIGSLQVALMSCKPFINFSWNGAGRPSVRISLRGQGPESLR